MCENYAFTGWKGVPVFVPWNGTVFKRLIPKTKGGHMSYSHTVVGIFESDFAAQDAVDALINKGFDRSEIDVRNHRDISGHPVKEDTESGQFEDHKESALTSFFKTIFGDKNEEANKHYQVVSRGGAVVTVYAKTEEEAMRASDVLDDNGAIDVDDRAAKYASANTSDSARITSANEYSAETSPRSGSGDFKNPIITKHESEYAKSGKSGGVMDEDSRELPRVEERSGPGIGSETTAGKRSRSRINEWQGEASSRLREDRDSETKIGW
jgi:hypothetical protein